MSTTRLRDDQPACLAPGTAGVHSDSYYDPDGGHCTWCGAEPLTEPRASPEAGRNKRIGAL